MFSFVLGSWPQCSRQGSEPSRDKDITRDSSEHPGLYWNLDSPEPRDQGSSRISKEEPSRDWRVLIISQRRDLRVETPKGMQESDPGGRTRKRVSHGGNHLCKDRDRTER